MSHKLMISARRVSHNIFHNIANRKFGKYVIHKFANKNGLIYFGAVDFKKDEYDPIRGFSVSTTHVDNHYCVGTIDDYDIKIVNRCDAITKVDGSFHYNNLLIASIDLKAKNDLPHIFINSKNHNKITYDLLFLNSPSLKEISLGAFDDYSHEFTSRFEIYANPAHFVEAQLLFPPNSANVMSSHFWPLSAEIHKNILYIYSDINRASVRTLDNIITVGLWMAKNIDSIDESI